MKKIIILIFCILFLTACEDYTEINDLAIITGLSLDYKDNKYFVTAQIVDNQSPEQTKVSTFSADAESIEKAVDKLSKQINKSIFISHLKALFITKNIIKENINFYDSFIRNPKARLNFNIFLLDDKITGEDILNYKSNEDNSSIYLKSLLKFNKDKFSSALKLNFHKFLTQMYKNGQNVIYPVVSFENLEKKDKLIIKNLATYNYKSEEFILNDEEAIIYNIISNEASGTVIDINCENNIYSLEMDESDTRYKWKNNILKVEVDIGSYLSSYNCKWDLSDKDTEKKLINTTKEQLLKRINAFIEKAQDKENDFFGIGNYIYKYDYNFFDFKKDIWDKKFKTINIETNVNISINNTGELKHNTEDKYEKSK